MGGYVKKSLKVRAVMQ